MRTARSRTLALLVVATPLAIAGASPVEALETARPARELEILRDLPYAATGNARQRLDLYLPLSRARARHPVVVYLHSGGWVSGDKAEGERFLAPLVETGRFAGVSAGYRLADDATWPAQLHDVQAAVRWVRANSQRYGLDPDRIAAWGWSAGGHLALMLGTTADVPALDGRLGPHAEESLRVTAVVNQAGISDLVAIDTTPVGRDNRALLRFASRLLGTAPRDAVDRAREASPVTHASPGDAPVFTFHGTADRTVPYDQAVRLHRALRDAGVPATLETVLRAGHVGLPARVEARIGEFLARWLLAPPGGT